jgi:hypothetical protein
MKPSTLFSVLSLIATALSMHACAFKSDPAQDAQATLPPVISAQIAWWDAASMKSPTLARTLEWHADQRLARAGLPVTLPVSVPDRVEVELSFPTPLATLDPTRVLVEIVGASGKPVAVNPKQVVIATQSPDVTSAIVELEGAKSLLSEVAESSLELRVLIQAASGETPLTAALTLRSPPSSLGIMQTRLSDAALDSLSHVEGIKSIRTGGLDYTLMQVVRIHNHSTQTLEIQVPAMARAGLVIHRTTYAAMALGACGFDAAMWKNKVPLPGELKLLPITENLPKLLARQLDPITLGKTVIQPDQEAPIGIYVSGDTAKMIAAGQFEKSKPTKSKFPDHCEARCEHKRMGPGEFPLCWSGGTNGHYNIPYYLVQSCIDCSSGNQKSCDQCSAWENGTGANFNQAGPNCLYCGELAETGHFDNVVLYKAIPEWHQEVIYAENVLIGNEDGAITFDSDPASALLTLRFADGSAADDPMSRELSFLKASVPQEQE